MMTTARLLRYIICAMGLVLASAAFLPRPAAAQNQHMEIIHHPNYDKNVFMPFVPAIKIKSGKILWLAGTTALPVYHDHPHKRDEIQQYMTNDLETASSKPWRPPARHSRMWCTSSCCGLGLGWATSARQAQ